MPTWCNEYGVHLATGCVCGGGGGEIDRFPPTTIAVVSVGNTFTSVTLEAMDRIRNEMLRAIKLILAIESIIIIIIN